MSNYTHNNGYVPFPEPHHIHPPYPYTPVHRYHTDTEEAFVVRPGEECCPGEGDECVCVTSADAELWNQAAENIGKLSPSAIDALSALSAFTNVATSADLWNQTYGKVEEGEPRWNEISALQPFKQATEEKFENIDTAIENTNIRIDDVSSKIPHLYFDTGDEPHWSQYPSMEGDGTSANPYRVRDWDSYHNVKDELHELMTHIDKISAAELGTGIKYITDGAEYYYHQLMNAVISAQIPKEEIAKIANEAAENYIKDKNYMSFKLMQRPTTSAEAAQYKEPNTIYYC